MAFSGQLAKAQLTGEITGFLYDAATGEPVIFTVVTLENTNIGTTSDVNGYFGMTKIKPGTYTILVTSLGFDTLRETVEVQAGKVVRKKLFLKETIRELQAVEIKTTRSKTARENTVNASITRITPKEIKIMPSVGGEPDLAQYIQTIPGVVFTGDQGGQLYIRGGTPVQTLTLLDGMMVYNPFHSIGLFSVFDTDIIKNADVYTGGFPGEYGGRASAVIDVKTNDGNKNRLTGRLSANPFTSKILLEGPLGKFNNNAGTSFVLSHRNSYLDRTSRALYTYATPGKTGLPFNFNDTYGKLTLHGGNGSKISFYGMNFIDNAKLAGSNDAFNWYSRGGGTSFILLPGATSVLISGNLAYSDYKIKISEESIAPRESKTSNVNFNLDFTYLKNKDELKYGIGIVANNTNFLGTLPDLKKEEFENNNTEFFAHFKYRIVRNRLIIDPGFRLHYYVSIGQAAPEPRLGIKYNLTEKLRLKAAGGLFSQNLISTQSDRDVVNLFTGFLSSPDDVYTSNAFIDRAGVRPVDTRLQSAWHFITGVEYDINDEIELNLEPYVKNFYDFININRDRAFSNQPFYILESGLARGVDFLGKYNKEPFFLQLGYSFAKVDRTFDGVTYAPVYDRRHNMNFIGSYTFGPKKSFEFDVRWNFGSGFPFTQTVGFYEDINLRGLNRPISQYNGQLGIYYGTLADFNRGRLPYYHRLDISIKKKIELSNNANLEVVGSVVNVYDRRNVFYFDRVTYQRVNQLPILPAIGINLKF
jgi:hypothetical protein